MNKANLIAALAAATDNSKAEAANFLDALDQIAAEQIIRGHDFTIPGIVTLKVKDRAARTGRNPGTGALVDVPAGRKVAAVVNAGLKRALK